MRSLVFRAVLLLLIVRVFGAPMALRPHDRAEQPGGGLVFRVCNWPDQHRLSPSEVVSIGLEAVASAPVALPPCCPPGSPGTPSPHRLEILSSFADYRHRSLGSLRC